MKKIALFEAFSGMGSLTRALADGMSAHAQVRVAGCAELDGRYLQHWSQEHPEGSTFRGSVSSYHPAELSCPCPGETRVFVAGIPCTGTSKAGRSKNKLSTPEEHAHVGHLFLTVAHHVRLHRPDVVIFENVAGYPKTLSARCLRRALKASGYQIFETIVNAFTHFNTPSERVRWTMVATRKGAFNWNPVAEPFVGTLAGYLDEPSDRDEADAFTETQVAGQLAYCARKQAEGCGFQMRLIDHASSKCPTICASYGKVQPTSTFVRTASSHRMLRPREVARLHGFPEDFRLPGTKTTAYEVLGQGVCYRPFRALGESVGEFVSSGERPFSLAA